MRIQYCSDLHIEFYDKKNKGRICMTQFLNPSAPYLALCGDIGNPSRPAYREFLRQCSEAFERVFIIPGNHEYYNFDQKGGALYSMHEKNAQMEGICNSFSNVVWLHEKAVRLEKEGVWICGATLWNDVTKEKEKEAEDMMNDYSTIRLEKGRAWKAIDTRIEHRKQRGLLQYYIDKAAALKEPIIVLTHHLPSFSFIHPLYKESKTNYCYASACDDMIHPPVIAWLCGHTHKPLARWLENGVFCGINPWGYPHEDGMERNKSAVFEWPRFAKKVKAKAEGEGDCEKVSIQEDEDSLTWQ